MSEGKFTRGPWEVDRRANFRVFQSGNPARGICSAGGYSTTEHDFTDENIANARLIASCPTMYEYIERKAQEGDSDAAKIIDAIRT